MHILSRRVTRSAAALLVALSVTAGAAAQQPLKEDPVLAANAPILRDFIHYTLIARYDLAAAMAQQLLSSGMTPGKFVDLMEATGEADRFENTIGRAQRIPELEASAGALMKLFERGKLERVRDPAEISRNIGLLTGLARARTLARERLAAAGEYAMPQLLGAFLQRSDVELSAQAGRLLVDMGRQAIIPLCTALPRLDPVGQERVVDVLGQMQYRTSVPFIVDLRASTGSDSVRNACDRALQRLGVTARDPADLYAALADAYYSERSELTNFPGEQHQLLWSYQPEVGLAMTAIRTEVFHEAMAMRAAERSLALQPEGNSALPLWLASNFSREIDTPREYANPAYPSDRRDAMYFAVAAGAAASQTVLGRALDDRDTPLARRAIEAIDRTAGAGSLWGAGGSRRPLTEALRYPNRRVQYEAALALGGAQPGSAFDGAERVVPILASAIRDVGDHYAVVVTRDNESYTTLRKVLEGLNYSVLPFAPTLREQAQAIAETPGVDVLVSQLPAEATAELIADARANRTLAATPILALTSSQGYVELAPRFGKDMAIAIRPQGLGENVIQNAVRELVETATGGPITADEARDYANRCLAVLRELAISGNAVFSIDDATGPLVAAISKAEGKARLDIADVLARIDDRRAQVAVVDAALAAQGADRITLLGAAADSAKRFGNQAEQRQVDRVVQLARSGSGEEATAAAALLGSLNLPNSDVVPLIIGGGR